MFDRLSIRTKLIAIVAAPLAVIVALAALGFTERSEEAERTRADAARLEALAAAQALQHELQLEALFSVEYLAGGDDASPEALEAQRTEVDEAAATFEAELADVSDPAVVAAGRTVVKNVEQLDEGTRPQVDARTLDWTWAESLYRSNLAAIPPLSNRIVDSIEDGELAQQARSVIALGDYMVSQARIGVLLAGAAAVGEFPEIGTGDTEGDEVSTGASTRRQFVEAVDRAETQLAIVGAQSGSRVRTQLRNQMVGGDLTLFADTVEVVRAQAADAAVEIDPAAWRSAVEATLQQLRDITSAEIDVILDLASDQVAAAEAAARLYLAGALVAVIVAIGLAIAVATSIARPVMSLTAAADRVATEQLPKLVDALRNPAEDDIEHLRPQLEDLDVSGGRELARLSAAVNQIQEVAVNVATEQATMLRKGIGDMFINLARRNQGLLDRQLEFIDELEAQEEDPDQLEHLFKLDHMATRMRRNAESLLVLAGAEPGRRRGKPVPLTKVALAAVGEIEHFARIDLLDVDECDVVSSAAADLAHLLSELMENATQFSPPDSRVEVLGHRTNGGGYTVSITDQGIGMSADQLADANQLLARPPLLGLTLARTLGFIVVGRLAARHNIAVRLVPSPAGGVTSIVSIPSAVLVPTLSTVDLSDSAPSPAPTRSTASSSLQTIDTPSSILPPFEIYTSGLSDDDLDLDGQPEPAGAAEPVTAFDPGTPIDSPSPLSASPFLEAPSADAAPPSPFDAPVVAEETVTAMPALLGTTPGDGSALAPLPDLDAPATLDEALGTGRDPEVELRDEGVLDAPVPATLAPVAAPEPLPGEADMAPALRTNPLFGPQTPAAGGAGPEPLGPLGDDSAPTSRLFGAAPAAPPAAPAGGAHLFRTTPAAPEAPVPSDGAAPTLPRRDGAAAPANGNGALPTRGGLFGGAAQPGAPTAPASGAGSGDAPELTSAGLVKRVPRRAGGQRAVPGSDGPGRAAATSTRSPDEVRAMLSRFHSGKQAGLTPGSETSTSSPDTKDS